MCLLALRVPRSCAGQQSPSAAEPLCAPSVAGQESPSAAGPFCAPRTSVAGQQSPRAVESFYAVLCLCVQSSESGPCLCVHCLLRMDLFDTNYSLARCCSCSAQATKASMHACLLIFLAAPANKCAACCRSATFLLFNASAPPCFHALCTSCAVAIAASSRIRSGNHFACARGVFLVLGPALFAAAPFGFQ